jgi:hypothetical protein
MHKQLMSDEKSEIGAKLRRMWPSRMTVACPMDSSRPKKTTSKVMGSRWALCTHIIDCGLVDGKLNVDGPHFKVALECAGVGCVAARARRRSGLRCARSITYGATRLLCMCTVHCTFGAAYICTHLQR